MIEWVRGGEKRDGGEEGRWMDGVRNKSKSKKVQEARTLKTLLTHEAASPPQNNAHIMTTDFSSRPLYLLSFRKLFVNETR